MPKRLSSRDRSRPARWREPSTSCSGITTSMCLWPPPTLFIRPAACGGCFGSSSEPGGFLVGGEDAVPAHLVGVSPGLSGLAQALPPSVHDLDVGRVPEGSACTCRRYSRRRAWPKGSTTRKTTECG